MCPHTREAYYYYASGNNMPNDGRLYPLTQDRENGGVGPMLIWQAREQGIDAICLEIVVPEYIIGHQHLPNYPYMRRLADKAHELAGMHIDPDFLNKEVAEYFDRYMNVMMRDPGVRARIEDMERDFDAQWPKRLSPVQLSPDIENFLNEL